MVAQLHSNNKTSFGLLPLRGKSVQFCCDDKGRDCCNASISYNYPDSKQIVDTVCYLEPFLQLAKSPQTRSNLKNCEYGKSSEVVR